jgi:hypothetical protein
MVSIAMATIRNSNDLHLATLMGLIEMAYMFANNGSLLCQIMCDVVVCESSEVISCAVSKPKSTADR